MCIAVLVLLDAPLQDIFLQATQTSTKNRFKVSHIQVATPTDNPTDKIYSNRNATERQLMILGAPLELILKVQWALWDPGTGPKVHAQSTTSQSVEECRIV